ncbi:hypothetical protein ACT009_11515 [Sphingomonas sp. Tas61C01]|uniref:hypothetical protein n=1 Tax=Sphingomonas sp. Tas61C01 TaxID=3458297 RepID=UPI00403E549D
MSDSRPSADVPDFDAIGLSASAAEERLSEQPVDKRLQALEDRLASIEPLLEQLQANGKIGPALSNYVAQLESEQRFFNEARWAVGAIALVAILLLAILLGMALFSDKSPLLKAAPAAIAAFVLGVISGIVFLLNSFIKGVFRSTAERHADGFLPPALEKAAEAYGKLTGNSRP